MSAAFIPGVVVRWLAENHDWSDARLVEMVDQSLSDEPHSAEERAYALARTRKLARRHLREMLKGIGR